MKTKDLFCIIIVLMVSGSCRETPAEPDMPEAPDYSDTSAWYISGAEEDCGADVFYILPTCVWDWTDSTGRVLHFADIRNPGHIAAMYPSNELADSIFGKYADFYSPYYRQITLDSWSSEEIAEERFPYAMADVYEAFDYYMEHWNSGRPFFIAGFSQGAKCVVELLKSLASDEISRLVAAYVIGYKVTDEDLENGNIVPARCADDTGVTVCYNSVSSTDAVKPEISSSAICINPVNWSCGPGPAVMQDSVTVSADPECHVLLLEGLDDDRYYRPSLSAFFPKGNYHLQELVFYQDYLRENVRTRIRAYSGGH